VDTLETSQPDPATKQTTSVDRQKYFTRRQEEKRYRPDFTRKDTPGKADAAQVFSYPPCLFVK
jgi:hypothetical protein